MVIVIFSALLYFSLTPTPSKSQSYTLLFTEPFNSLDGWTPYFNPYNATIQLSDQVYNSSDYGLHMIGGGTQACLIHPLPEAANSTWYIRFVFMPVNTSYSNFYIYKDFSGPVDRISLGLIDNNTSLDINGIPNQYNLTVGQWNLIEILINENNTATVKVNGVEVGSYSVSSITPEGVQDWNIWGEIRYTKIRFR